MAVVLVVPIIWGFASRLNRLGVARLPAAMWAALLAVACPSTPWFGQETRLCLMGISGPAEHILVLRWSTAMSPRGRKRYLIGYAPVLVAFLSTHYFSMFLLPFQALIALLGLKGRRRWLALMVVGCFLVVAGLASVMLASRILQQPGAGTNFQSVSLRMLIPDLTNAFSLGLSVDIDRVRWLDLVYGTVAFGLVWGLRSVRYS
jgi:hypothetical protein